jgi:hypothetical protein
MWDKMKIRILLKSREIIAPYDMVREFTYEKLA